MDTVKLGGSSRWQVASGAIYALFVLVVPALTGAGWGTWLLTVAALGSFAFLYLDFFRQWSQSPRRQVVDLLLIASLGFGLLPLNVGATTFVIYGAALAPFVFRPMRSVAFFTGLSAALWVEMTIIGRPDVRTIVIWNTSVIVIVGLGNLFISDRVRQIQAIRRAQEEVEEMAKVAERERIARDLHDLLGHTLSVIALKSELASKLADRDPARAVAEIREVERVSREALAEVRAAVQGYKSRGLSGELHNAQQALVSAGVRLDTDVPAVLLSPRHETVLALTLRETITNVVRHARASACRVVLAADGADFVLTIQDDGVGGPLREGNGLMGIRERVTAAGGTLAVDSRSGVRISVRLPMAGASA